MSSCWTRVLHDKQPLALHVILLCEVEQAESVAFESEKDKWYEIGKCYTKAKRKIKGKKAGDDCILSSQYLSELRCTCLDLEAARPVYHAARCHTTCCRLGTGKGTGWRSPKRRQALCKVPLYCSPQDASGTETLAAERLPAVVQAAEKLLI